MMTREEFGELLYDYGCSRARVYHGDESERVLAVGKESALLAAFDAQAARIAQLEREVHLVRERNAELASQRLEADDRAYYEGRIAELEAALNALYEHTKNNRQICGLNERARAVLDKEAGL